MIGSVGSGTMATAAVGALVIAWAGLGGAPLDAVRRYHVVTNGGMLHGTHRYTALAEGADIVREPTRKVTVPERAMREADVLRALPSGDVTVRS